MKDAIILTVESVRTRASTNEALITFALPLEQASNVSHFMGIIGSQVAAAFAEVGPTTQQKAVEPEDPPEGMFGKEAQALRLSSFFRTPDVWSAIGTDKDFLKWIRHQKCAYCNSADYIVGIGEERAEAAHVRRVANGSGTSIKPEYSAIPLCRTHHRIQHNEGEASIGGVDWWEKKRMKYVIAWAWETLKGKLNHESWADVPPSELKEWAEIRGVEKYLPEQYR